MPQLGDPEDERGDANDQEPVLEAQTALDGIEEALQPGDLDQGDLPEEDHAGDDEQSSAALEVERTAAGGEGAGVEEVEELQHHKRGEEERQLVGRQSVRRTRSCGDEVAYGGHVGVLEVVE